VFVKLTNLIYIFNVVVAKKVKQIKNKIKTREIKRYFKYYGQKCLLAVMFIYFQYTPLLKLEINIEHKKKNF